MDIVRRRDPLRPDNLGQLKTESAGVNSVVAAMVLAYVEALERQRRLFGWNSDEWLAAVIEGLSAVRSAFPTSTS